jgi:hypothetical protein
MTPDDVAMFQSLFDSVGYWALPVITVMLGVRVFRAEPVQKRLPERFRWSSLKLWQRILIIGVASFASALATALTTGQGWKAAAFAAIPVALSAAFGHKVTKIVGHTMTEVAVAKKPNYSPSKFRKAASIVVPLDAKRVRDAAKKLGG